MENFLFFHLYRDPLFGIIIFIAIIATIALLDYSRNRYRAQKKENSLKELAKSYEYTTFNEDIARFIQTSPDAIQPLMFMAKSYAQSGDNERAIQIYLSILESITSPKDKILALQGLGSTYLHAGFLQRAKNIFTEILHAYPRKIEALKSLIQTYERMGEYEKALEVLECLDEAQSDPKQPKSAELTSLIKNAQSYFHLMILVQSHHIPLTLKIKNLKEIGKNYPIFNRIILNFLKINDKNVFWDYAFGLKSIRNTIDIFYTLQCNALPSRLIHYPPILEIFVAKGEAQSDRICEVFELEMLRLVRQTKEADLSFQYRCHHCKEIFPFDSVRCPICLEFGEMDLIINVLESPRTGILS